MSYGEDVTTMRLRSGNSLRSILVAVAALIAVGIAFRGDLAQGRAQSDPLVRAQGEQELQDFAVVDMVDALDRVAGSTRSATDASDAPE
jgi:hypothetical protein